MLAEEEGEVIDVKMLFSNKTADDILLKDELEKIAQKCEENVKITHTLTRVDNVEPGMLKGRVTLDMLK